jgi:FkbM family methyltransferase
MIWDDFKQVYELLEDELSKKIYEEKVNWLFHSGEDCTKDLLYSVYTTSSVVGLDRYKKGTSFAICGAGKYGKQTLRALEHAGYKVVAFLDNDVIKQGKKESGVKIYSVSKFVRDFYEKNVVVILDNQRIANIFFSELYELGWDQKKIFRTKDDIVRSEFGNIYFDLPELNIGNNEIFLDAGSFDGATSKTFIKECGGSYKKIYALEPMKDAFELVKINLKDEHDVVCIKAALGDKVTKTGFSQSFTGLMGSRIGEHGDYVEMVDVETIDHILDGQPVSFIKFDIEGAELNALKGAHLTLSKYKPKLAISLYHKREDLIEIPLWLKRNIPDYKYYLRHYSNKQWDLVLYCV